jgi:hypothetical protein
MMKFTVKGLIALFVTSSALLLTPMRSDAQVNMKTLSEVAKSCQNDVFSTDYYKQMGLDINVKSLNSNFFSLGNCLYARYHYSLVLSRFPWLSKTGEILPGYPGSVAVGQLANGIIQRREYSPNSLGLLDCIITNDVSSYVCNQSRYAISHGSGVGFTDSSIGGINPSKLPYVCPSCVIAYKEVSGSGDVILKAFIEWFLKLDKPQRREVISLLGNDKLRFSLYDESEKAVDKYQETRARVQQQEREQRRRELLGN